jgi:hypothetical protein
MLSVWRLQSVDDRMINECGAVDGMRTGRVNSGKKQPQYHMVHHKSHMTRPGFEIKYHLWCDAVLIWYKFANISEDHNATSAARRV